MNKHIIALLLGILAGITLASIWISTRWMPVATHESGDIIEYNTSTHETRRVAP